MQSFTSQCRKMVRHALNILKCVWPFYDIAKQRITTSKGLILLIWVRFLGFVFGREWEAAKYPTTLTSDWVIKLCNYIHHHVCFQNIYKIFGDISISDGIIKYRLFYRIQTWNPIFYKFLISLLLTFIANLWM